YSGGQHLDCNRVNNWLALRRTRANKLALVPFVNLGYKLSYPNGSGDTRYPCIAGARANCIVAMGKSSISLIDVRMLSTVKGKGVTQVVADHSFIELTEVAKDIESRPNDCRGASFDCLDVQRTYNYYQALRELYMLKSAPPTTKDAALKEAYASGRAKDLAKFAKAEAAAKAAKTAAKRKREEEEEEE
ncbi:hypothetical protein TeGR_g13920, partial [Tetraparma gracilis]